MQISIGNYLKKSKKLIRLFASSLNMTSLKEDIKALRFEFSGPFIERDDEILGQFLAILANENVLYLGPPGTAKTDLARGVCRSVEGGHFFYYLLTRFTTPEEIFGPLSIKSLENDEFRRKTDGCLPASHIALLDEIFKANSSILNSLLTILNERRFHNGTDVIDTPLLTVFGASNELPEEDENLEALYDRFLFRYDVRYIQDPDNVKRLLSGDSTEFSPVMRITVGQIQKVQAQARSIAVPEAVMDIILSLKKELEQQDSDEKAKPRISDRRWKKILGVLKVAAAANDDKSVNRSMLLLLQHMLWDLPDQEVAIRTLIIERIATGGVDTGKLESGLVNLQEMITSGKEIVNDQNLPVPVYAHDNEGEKKITSYQGLIEESTNEHCSYFTIGTPHATCYAFDQVMEILQQKYRFVPKKSQRIDRKTVFEQEYRYLETQYGILRNNVRDEAGPWKNELFENIWLAQSDIDELLQVRDEILSRLPVLEEQLNAAKTILPS